MKATFRSPRLLLRLFVSLLLLFFFHDRFSLGLFEEQQGENEWLLRNVGLITHSIAAGVAGKVYVASANSVVACLSTKDGEIDWRAVLPQKTTIQKMVLGEDQLYTLTIDSHSVATVCAWSTTRQGTLLWETAVAASTEALDGTLTLPTDMVLDVSRGILTVLSGNVVHFLSTKQNGELLWDWMASEESDAQIASHAKGGLKPILTQLLSPLPLTAGAAAAAAAKTAESIDGERYVAVGCMLKEDRNSSPNPNPNKGCKKTMMIAIDHKKKTAVVTAYPGLPSIDPVTLKTNVANALSTNSFAANEIFYGVTTTSPSSTSTSASSSAPSTTHTTSIVHLSSGKLTSLDIPSSPLTQTISHEFASSGISLLASKSTTGLLLASASGDDTMIPYVSSCKSFNKNKGYGCDLFAISSSSSSSSSSDAKSSPPSLVALTSCGGNYAMTGTEQSHSISGVAISVQCMGVTVENASSSSISVNVARVTNGVVSGGGSGVVVTNSQVALPSHFGISDSSFLTQITKKDNSRNSINNNSKSSKHSHENVNVNVNDASTSSGLLVVDSTGLTIMIAPSSSSTSSTSSSTTKGKLATIAWARDEALSLISQAVIVDEEHFLVGDNTDINELQHNFAARLALQRQELSDSLEDFGKSLTGWPALLLGQLRRVFNINALFGNRDPAANTMEARLALAALKKTKKRNLLKERLKERQTNPPSWKVRRFGFNKVAVLLSSSSSSSSSSALSSSSSSSSSSPSATSTLSLGRGGGIRFADAGLKLSGLDLYRAVTTWSFIPTILDVNDAESEIVFTKLLTSSTTHRKHTVTLVVSLATGVTYFWNVDAYPHTSTASGSSSSSSSSSNTHSQILLQPTARFVLPGQPVSSVLHIRPRSTDEHYLLVHAASSEQHTEKVTLVPDFHPDASTTTSSVSGGGSSGGTNKTSSAQRAASLVQGEYVHLIDTTQGQLKTFTMGAGISAGNSGSGSGRVGNNNAIEFFTFHAIPVASNVFDPQTERIVSVTYPTSGDAIDRRFNVLGDDSILLKYLNPNIVLVITESVVGKQQEDETSAAAATASMSNGDQSTTTTSNSAGVPRQTQTLHANIFDTVSGKVVYRISHEGGTAPVQAALIENMCVYSYWNAQARRTEISTVALYEGMVDRWALNPVAATTGNSPVMAQLQKEATASSFSAPPPLGVQRTYVLPHSLTSIHHTRTAHGVSNKNVLMSLSTGQVFTVDMRLIHPRRPLSEPSQTEKEEGFFQYNPFVAFNPLMAVTLDEAVEGGVETIVSAPSALESTSLVLSFGSLDLHFNRVTPSQGFDLLASDFNYAGLVLILLSLGVGVALLRRMSQDKMLRSNWL